MTYFFKTGVAACVSWLIFLPTASFGNDDLKLDGQDSDSMEPVANLTTDPELLVNYSWRILDSIDKNDIPCRNDRCFREGDFITVLNRVPVSSQPCSAELDLVLTDLSSGGTTPYYGINGRINGCNNQTTGPSSIEFLFWDPVEGEEEEEGRECREIEITPVRMNSRVTEDQCKNTLKTLTGLNGQKFESVFGNSCGGHPLIHWQVASREPETGQPNPCDGEPALNISSPPEPGQGTGSGGGY